MFSKINYNAISTDRWIFKKLLKTKKSLTLIYSLKTSWNQISLIKLNENFKYANFLVLVISEICS